jgi:hypothetical protein
MKYTLTVGFNREKHCVNCPVRDMETDTCNAQRKSDGTFKAFKSWEENMKNCPLALVNETPLKDGDVITITV